MNSLHSNSNGFSMTACVRVRLFFYVPTSSHTPSPTKQQSTKSLTVDMSTTKKNQQNLRYGLNQTLINTFDDHSRSVYKLKKRKTETKKKKVCTDHHCNHVHHFHRHLIMRLNGAQLRACIDKMYTYARYRNILRTHTHVDRSPAIHRKANDENSISLRSE